MENNNTNNSALTTDVMTQTLLNPAVFEQMQRSAKLFADSGLVPETFQGKVAACFVGLQLAAQLKVSPFMLFQHIYVVKGKVGIEAQIAIGLANASKVFRGPIKHTFTGSGTNRACTASAVLTASGEEVTLTLDWNTVKAEGWDNKKMGVSKWLTMPDQMFRYRTSMWLIRTYAPEVLLGLQSIDELDDEQIINVTPKKTIDEALAEESKKVAVKKAEKAKEDAKKETVIEPLPKQIKKKTEPKEEEAPFELVAEEPKAKEPLPHIEDIKKEIKAMGLSSMELIVATTKACKKYAPLDKLSGDDALKLLNKLKAERKQN